MKHTGIFTPESLESKDDPTIPDWVPDDARVYLQHVSNGKTMQSLARTKSGHTSTISRQVKRLEARRDDPLVDAALASLEASKPGKTIAGDGEFTLEARRVLRRLCETGAFMIVASSMEKAAVMREGKAGNPRRVAVLDQHVAEAFALKDWIECYRKGKIALYRITNAGRTALKRMLVQDGNANPRGANQSDPFQEQHKEWATSRTGVAPEKSTKRIRYNLAESPITALGRRRCSDGKPFLSADLVQAGEQLREDFEMAQMGARVTQNWDRFLTGGRSGGFSGAGPCEGPTAARARVAEALKYLGTGLSDIALRCCCFLEGMEAAEKRMGWSARSGKIVLRIALQRLKTHYDEVHGAGGPKIG